MLLKLALIINGTLIVQFESKKKKKKSKKKLKI
jgi:hypothetical protein